MRHHHAAKAAALTALTLALNLLLGCAPNEEPAHLALILSNAQGHYWENIVDGAQTAAQRMGVILDCYAPDEEEGIALESLPARAMEDGADAVIAATQGEEELLDALSQINIPILAVGTAFSQPQPVSTLLNDDAKMGENAARALASELGAGDQVLLLTDSAEFRESELREFTLRKDLEAQGVEVRGRLFSGDNMEWAYRQTLQQLYLWPDLDAVVAFSAQSSVGAALAAEYLDRDVAIVGTDIVPDLIECIEDGSVSATIVRNSFGMGYLGVEYAVDVLEGEEVPEVQTLSSVVVTRDNLFTPEIEKVVFPYE